MVSTRWSWQSSKCPDEGKRKTKMAAPSKPRFSLGDLAVLKEYEIITSIYKIYNVGYVYYAFVHPRYNSLDNPTRQQEVWRKILLNINWADWSDVFIDLVSTNMLLAMLGFPLSQKSHANFCYKPSMLFFIIFFFFLDDLHLQLLKSFPSKHQPSKLLDSSTAGGCNY